MEKPRLFLYVFILLEITAATALTNKFVNNISGNSVYVFGTLITSSSNPADNDTILKTDMCSIAEPDNRKMLPDCSCVINFGSVPIEPFTLATNSAGFRDYEYEKEHPSTYRIIFLGDSVVAGYGVGLNDTVAKVLERMLTKAQGRKVEVLNLGVSGSNTFTEAKRLEELGLSYKPDMVIIGFHGNDLENYTKIYKCQQNASKKYDGMNMSKAENILGITKASLLCVEDDWADMSGTSNDELYGMRVEPSMEKIYNLSVKNGFDVFVVTSFFDRPFPPNYLGSLRKITDKFGWELIDVNGYVGNLTDGYRIEPYVLNGRDFHPNSLGHTLMAEYIFRNINDSVSSEIASRYSDGITLPN